MQNYTVLAFDFGTKSIGCAVGQTITATAQPLAAIKAKDGIPNWGEIANYLKIWEPKLVVIGLPLNMDGTEQELTIRTQKFANRVHGRFGVKVALHDERLTTVDAKTELFAAKGFKGLEKGKVDSISACLILESWFNENL